MRYYIGLVPFEYGSYIEHHGILGQRWGIRRFQNRDGTFTQEGKKRYKYLYENAAANTNGDSVKQIDTYRSGDRHSIKANNGIQTENRETDVLKAGSKTKRVTKGVETVDNRRKYAAITDSDVATYTWDFLESNGFTEEAIKKTDPVYIDEYTLVKNIKIASPEKVCDWALNEIKDVSLNDITLTRFKKKGASLVSAQESATKVAKKYGWKNVNDIINDPVIKETKADFINPYGRYGTLSDTDYTDYANIFPELAKKEKLSKIDKKFIENINNRIKLGREIINEKANRMLYLDDPGSKLDKMMKDLKKEGYDASIDMEDLKRGIQYPIILFDPVEVAKRTGHELAK